MARLLQYVIRRSKLDPDTKVVEQKLYLAYDAKRHSVKWWGDSALDNQSKGSLLMMFPTREAGQEYLERHELKDDKYWTYEVDEVAIRLDFKIPKPKPEPEITAIPEPAGQPTIHAAVPAFP